MRLNYIFNIFSKIKTSEFLRDPRVLYGLISVAMFVIGLIVGANFFRKNSDNLQVSISVDDQVKSKTSQESQNKSKSITISQINKPNKKVVDNTRTITSTVRLKDSLENILRRNGINTKDVKTILALKQAKSLKNLSAGKKIKLSFERREENPKLTQLVYEIDDLNTLTVVAHRGNWQAHVKHIEPTVKVNYASAVVNGSIYTAASKKGISSRVIAKLANIFADRIDFRKMYRGDSFGVFYKEYFVNGKKIKDGEIVAAEIVHNKRAHRMIGFTDPKGNTEYYTPEGRTTKPQFIRYPIANYTRIGSRFSSNRFHPILKFRRPHLGVDFVAPKGTPIKATCDGKVEFVGDRNGHGCTVIVKNGEYKTLYAHLSKYAKSVRVGGHVKQGQVVGYVGSTGLATGPHLHYEFQVNGVHKDPLKVKLPDGRMIAPEYRKQFFAKSEKMIAKLDLYNGNSKMLARNESDLEEV